MTARLALEHVSKTYTVRKTKVHALASCSLTVAKGEFVLVQGPSGSGKSTLLLVTGGLLRPDTGRVTVDGQDLYQLGSEERARYRAESIGFIFQQFHLISYLTVLENVMVPIITRHSRDGRLRAEEMLARVGLTERQQHRPSELSVGERQRVALARAIMNQPRLLLADEPTGNLDPENAEIVLRFLQQFSQEGGTVLMVSHSYESAFSDRTVYLKAGLVTVTENNSVPKRM